ELRLAGAPPFGAEVVERDRARDLAEPGLRGAAFRVEAVPEPKRALERRAGELVGGRSVAGEPGEVSVDVVEVRLGSLRKSHLTRCTPLGGRTSQPATTGNSPGRGRFRHLRRRNESATKVQRNRNGLGRFP